MSEKWARARGADSSLVPARSGAAWSPVQRVLGLHPGLAAEEGGPLVISGMDMGKVWPHVSHL